MHPRLPGRLTCAHTHGISFVNHVRPSPPPTSALYNTPLHSYTYLPTYLPTYIHTYESLSQVSFLINMVKRKEIAEPGRAGQGGHGKYGEWKKLGMKVKRIEGRVKQNKTKQTNKQAHSGYNQNP